jgi:hypothetical protein
MLRLRSLRRKAKIRLLARSASQPLDRTEDDRRPSGLAPASGHARLSLGRAGASFSHAVTL